MSSEIISQTLKDSGQHSNSIGIIIGSLITIAGFFIKFIGSAVYTKWSCMTADISNLKEIAHVQDKEIEQLRDMITEMRIENRNNIQNAQTRIDTIMRESK
jgi:hypothetical protein